MSGSCGTQNYSMGHYAMPWAYSLLASDEHQRGNVRTDLKRDKKKLKSKPKGQDNELLIEASLKISDSLTENTRKISETRGFWTIWRNSRRRGGGTWRAGKA